MSTITVQTISNGSVSTSSANVIQGSAKAWVNFNGTGTVAIRASYNVSSITDNGTGDYTVNFTNAMVDANYGFTLASDNPQAFTPTGTGSAASIKFFTRNGSSVLADSNPVSVQIFR